MNTLLKRLSIACLLLASLGGTAAGLAHAQERDRRQDQRQEMGGQGRSDTQRSNYQVPDQRRVTRMSPEERQALRRQINEAGQDIYVRPRR